MIIGNPHCELVGLVEIESSVHSELCNEFKVPVFSDFKEFVNASVECDVICICTPNYLHAPLAISALENKYHVVVEKPMAISKADCEAIIHTSLKVSKLVFCVMQNRYSPPSVWLKDIVDKKVLGDIHMVLINCFWNRDSRYYKKSNWKGNKTMDGGTLFTQFSHFVDVMYWLFGDVKNIQAKFFDFNHQELTDFEDSGNITLDFVNGGSCSFNYSTAINKENFESSLTIIGEKGTVKVGGQYMNVVEYCNIEGYEMPQLEESNPPNDYGPYKGSAANHHYVFENVVDAVNGINTVTTNALEGLKVVEIIENIYNQKK